MNGNVPALPVRGEANMNSKVIKDVLFGAIAGLAGTVVIGKTMGLLSRLQNDRDKWVERELVREQPTTAFAKRVAENGFGVDLSEDRAHQLGQAVRWGYGIFWGSVYGVL